MTLCIMKLFDARCFSLKLIISVVCILMLSQLIDTALAGEALKSSLYTDKEARVLHFRVPAPRGAILDRNGEVLAKTVLKKSLLLRFEKHESPEAAWNFFKTKIQLLSADKSKSWSAILEREFEFKKTDIIQHYKNRRWYPFTLVSVLKDEELEKIEKRLAELGEHPFVLEDIYSREYIDGDLTAHVVGRVGSLPMPDSNQEIPALISGREAFLEPLFIEWEGQEGIEKQFDKELKGQDGLMEIIVDSNNNERQRRLIKKPLPGNNIIIAIDKQLQKSAREALKKKAKRGAFILMDNRTGELLVSVSLPSFDPSLFIPKITQENFNKLKDDPNNPLLARAWQGQYPPGSTFKTFTAIAGLEGNYFDIPWSSPGFHATLGHYGRNFTVRDCPMDLAVGNVTFPNWYRHGSEGRLNLYEALARSCNTYFIPIGVRLGSKAIISMAERFGFGKATGLDLAGETVGLLPQEEVVNADGSVKKTYFGPGHAANISIGQGDLLVTPLQIVRAFSAVATRGHSPSPKLIVQTKTSEGEVVKDFIKQDDQKFLEPKVNENILRIVERGLYEVVYSKRGTGIYARNTKVLVAGKSGTAQWKHKNQYVAWFAGYVAEPNSSGNFNYPYSFVVAVEGDRGEAIGGATYSAPAIGALLQQMYKDKDLPFQVKMSHMELPMGEVQSGYYADQNSGYENSGQYYGSPNSNQYEAQGGYYSPAYGQSSSYYQQQVPSQNYPSNNSYAPRQERRGLFGGRFRRR